LLDGCTGRDRGRAGPVFDVNGRDVRNSLQLIAKGNATLVVWLTSRVYRQDDSFVQRLWGVAPLMQGLSQPEACIGEPEMSPAGRSRLTVS